MIPPYRVDYWCTSQPRNPFWRTDGPETDSLDAAIRQALTIHASGRIIRIVDGDNAVLPLNFDATTTTGWLST